MYYNLSHYEVDVVEKRYNDGQPMLTDTYRFTYEEEAIKYANKRYKEGKNVYVRLIQHVDDWVNIYEN